MTDEVYELMEELVAMHKIRKYMIDKYVKSVYLDESMECVTSRIIDLEDSIADRIVNPDKYKD